MFQGNNCCNFSALIFVKNYKKDLNYYLIFRYKNIFQFQIHSSPPIIRNRSEILLNHFVTCSQFFLTIYSKRFISYKYFSITATRNIKCTKNTSLLIHIHLYCILIVFVSLICIPAQIYLQRQKDEMILQYITSNPMNIAMHCHHQI